MCFHKTSLPEDQIRLLRSPKFHEALNGSFGNAHDGADVICNEARWPMSGRDRLEDDIVNRVDETLQKLRRIPVRMHLGKDERY